MKTSRFVFREVFYANAILIYCKSVKFVSIHAPEGANWEEIPLSRINSIPLKGEVSNQ
jgi:hypothetical protein